MLPVAYASRSRALTAAVAVGVVVEHAAIALGAARSGAAAADRDAYAPEQSRSSDARQQCMKLCSHQYATHAALLGTRLGTTTPLRSPAAVRSTNAAQLEHTHMLVAAAAAAAVEVADGVAMAAVEAAGGVARAEAAGKSAWAAAVEGAGAAGGEAAASGVMGARAWAAEAKAFWMAEDERATVVASAWAAAVEGAGVASVSAAAAMRSGTARTRMWAAGRVCHWPHRSRLPPQ